MTLISLYFLHINNMFYTDKYNCLFTLELYIKSQQIQINYLQ